jgi:hypothetical protein
LFEERGIPFSSLTLTHIAFVFTHPLAYTQIKHCKTPKMTTNRGNELRRRVLMDIAHNVFDLIAQVNSIKDGAASTAAGE